MIPDIINIPNSSLILFNTGNPKLLFCTTSLALCKISIESLTDTLRYINDEILPIWPKTQINQNNNKSDKISLSVNLSQKCNLSCQYCYLHGSDISWPSKINKYDEKFSISLIKEKIHSLISLGNKTFELNFFGGEPLLMLDEIIDISEYTLKIGNSFKIQVNIGVTTNGVLLTPSFLQWSQENNVEILLSIDSPPSLHEKYRARGKPYAQFYEIQKNVNGFENNITAVTTVTSKTDSIYSALRLLIKLGFKEVAFNIVHTRDKNLFINVEDTQRLLNDFWENKSWFFQYSNKITNLKILHKQLTNRNVKVNPCSAGINSFAIGPDNNSYLCHSSVGNYKYQLDRNGHLRDYKYNKRFFKDSFDYPCNKCWAKNLCGGDCWIIQWEYNISERINRCRIIRGLAQLAITIYPK